MTLSNFLFVIIIIYVCIAVSFVLIRFLKSYLEVLCFISNHFSFCNRLVFQNNRFICWNFHRSYPLNLLKLLVVIILFTILISAWRIRLRVMRLLQLFQIILIHFMRHGLRRCLKNIDLLIGCQITFYSICYIMNLLLCFLSTLLWRCKLLLKLDLLLQLGRCFVDMRLLIYQLLCLSLLNSLQSLINKRISHYQCTSLLTF
jgi:hypothetical protein